MDPRGSEREDHSDVDFGKGCYLVAAVEGLTAKGCERNSADCNGQSIGSLPSLVGQPTGGEGPPHASIAGRSHLPTICTNMQDKNTAMVLHLAPMCKYRYAGP